jgi:ubiquinone/menaquinone biosynthesis C-methylase UbiE
MHPKSGIEFRSVRARLAQALCDGGEPTLEALACGDGYLLGLLRHRAGVGTDWNVAELKAAQNRLGSLSPLIRADDAWLPIASAALGTVGCQYALMLLQPLEQVLAELARVLRPDVLFAIALPASPPDHAISAFRTAWREVTVNFLVDIQRSKTTEP